MLSVLHSKAINLAVKAILGWRCVLCLYAVNKHSSCLGIQFNTFSEYKRANSGGPQTLCIWIASIQAEDGRREIKGGERKGGEGEGEKGEGRGEKGEERGEKGEGRGEKGEGRGEKGREEKGRGEKGREEHSN